MEHRPPAVGFILPLFRRNTGYARRLTEDLPPEAFFAQPLQGRAINHAGWILCHLTLYLEVSGAMLRGEAPTDPVGHAHGIGSKVGPASAYASPDVIRARFFEARSRVDDALERACDAALDAPAPFERWRATNPTAGHALVMLLVKHESHHLGQLSVFRRALGLAPVEM